jgi:hypothetical protein
MQYDLSIDGGTVSLRFPGLGVGLSLHIDTVVDELTEGNQTLRALRPFMVNIIVGYIREHIEKKAEAAAGAGS